MIILTGKSGSGKDTVAAILSRDYGYKHIVSYTTRDKRIADIDKVSYNFITKEKFEELLKQGFFAEHTFYNGNYYGMALKDVDDNKVVLVEPEGFRQLKAKKNLHNISFFLEVPDKVRIKRMKFRGDTKENIAKRIETDKKVFEGLDKETDFIINNINAEKSAEKVNKAVKLYSKYKNNIKE